MESEIQTWTSEPDCPSKRAGNSTRRDEEKEERRGRKADGDEEALTADFERADRRPEALVRAETEGHGDQRLVVDEEDYNGWFFCTV